MSQPADRVVLLTPKERECLRLVLENRSSKDIARRLGISHTSVDTHIRRARAKLGLRDRYEAAQLLEKMERSAGDEAGAAGADATPARESDVLAALRALAPPYERLTKTQRLIWVFAAAVLLALGFGLIFNVLRSL